MNMLERKESILKGEGWKQTWWTDFQEALFGLILSKIKGFQKKKKKIWYSKSKEGGGGGESQEELRNVFYHYAIYFWVLQIVM